MAVPVPPDAGLFEADIHKALSRLRLCLGAVVVGLPEKPESASALARQLGLNRKIAWQVWRIIADGDSAGGGTGTAPILPGPAALDGFLIACARRGVAERVIDDARAASRRFDDLAILHGGDRATLMSLLRQAASGGAGGGAADSGADRAAETVRRQAWQASGEIWGTQTGAYLAAAVLAPASSDPDRIDDLSITAEVGIRRLRAGAPRLVAGLGFHNNDPRDPSGPPVPRALADLPPDSGMIEPMVPQFTSARVRLTPSTGAAPGQTLMELVDSPVGRRGEVNLVLAQFCPAVGRRWATEQVRRVHFSAHLFSPYGAVIQDLILHRDLWGRIHPTAKVYSALRGMMTQAKRDDRDILPIRADVLHLGVGLTALETQHIPDYAAILDWACARVGWNPEEFDVYRCLVLYPPMPSSLVLGVELPSPPSVTAG